MNHLRSISLSFGTGVAIISPSSDPRTVSGRSGWEIYERITLGQKARGVKARTPSGPGLVGPGAERAHGARRAGGLAGHAGAPAVDDQQVRALGEPALGQDLHELVVDLIGILRLGQPQALGDTEDVGVHGERVDAEGVAEHHVGGLEPHAGQLDEGRALARHLAAVTLDERLGHAEQRAGLGAEEARRADLALELLRPGLRQRVGSWIRLEQTGRDHVDALVGALRRENGGDQQLERRVEVERDLGVGISALEGVEDLARAGLLRRQRLAGHPQRPPSADVMRSAWSRTLTWPSSTGNGTRLAIFGAGSKLRTTQPTSASGTGTPPTRTRSTLRAKGRSVALASRTRAFTSGPVWRMVTASASPSSLTIERWKRLSPATNLWRSSIVIVADSSR